MGESLIEIKALAMAIKVPDEQRSNKSEAEPQISLEQRNVGTRLQKLAESECKN